MSSKIGLVSDTHALFDPALEALFEGCEAIVHAGDICSFDIMARLEALAPVYAVRGNCDEGLETESFPEHRLETIAGVRIAILHDLGRPGAPEHRVRELLARQRPEVVVSGHSHRPQVELQDGVLFVNPGSSGPRRFSLPRSAGLLRVGGGGLEVELVSIDPAAPGTLFKQAFPR